MKRQRVHLGDLVAIPLGKSRVVLARIFKDATIAVYDVTARSIDDLPADIHTASILTYAICSDIAIKAGRWPIVGHVEFRTQREAEPPARFIQDILDPEKYEICHMGKSRPATAKEIKGLEEVVAYSPDQLIQRIKQLLKNKV